MKSDAGTAASADDGATWSALHDLAVRCLDAIERNAPASARMSGSAVYTENAVRTDVGEGLWRTADKFASRQFSIDTVSGQVIVTGAVERSGKLHPYGVRLKAEDGEITEIEAMVSASTNGHFADVNQLLKPDVLYDAPVPPERRSGGRQGLAAVADRYWMALNESDGSLAMFNHRCDRYGNGKKITNSLALLLSPDAAVHTPASLITATRPARPRVVDRRFPVLDVERGVAGSIATVEFRKNADRPDVGAFYIFSVVKIVDSEFRNIDHLHAILPPGTRAPW